MPKRYLTMNESAQAVQIAEALVTGMATSEVGSKEFFRMVLRDVELPGQREVVRKSF
jgi:hypothetical protein